MAKDNQKIVAVGRELADVARGLVGCQQSTQAIIEVIERLDILRSNLAAAIYN